MTGYAEVVVIPIVGRVGRCWAGAVREVRHNAMPLGGVILLSPSSGEEQYHGRSTQGFGVWSAWWIR